MTVTRRLLFVAVVALGVTAGTVASPGPVGGHTRAALGTFAERVTGTVRRVTRHAAPAPAPDTSVATPVAAPTPGSAAAASAASAAYRRAGLAEPRSLQVITVPVPAQFGDHKVDYTVIPRAQTDLLSATSGTVAEGDRPSERNATIVARMPQAAAPGPLEVAQIEFRDEVSTATISVELVIAKVVRLTLRPTRTAAAVYAGQHAQLGFVVQNLGNGVDTLRVAADQMSGWRVEEIPALILAPGEQREVAVRVQTPPPPAAGTMTVIFRARNSDAEVARVSVAVEVLPDPSIAMRERGPVVTAGIGSVAGDKNGSSPVFGFEVSGPISSGVTLNGRLVQTTDRADFNPAAMSRIGYFVDGGFLNAAGRGWSVTAGRTGLAFSPLFGWATGGLGGSADLTYGRWNLGVLAVQERFGGRTGGEQGGVKLTRRLPVGAVTMTATHLEQSLVSDRQLDAAGLGYLFSSSTGLTLGAEVGYRSARDATGAAVSAQVEKRSPRGIFGLYAAHAPGGSGAFARATDEATGNLWRQLSPALGVRMFGYATKDDPGTGGTSRSRGGSVGPSVRLTDRTSVTFDVSTHVSEFDAFDPALGNSTSGSGELMATIGGQTTLGQTDLTASVGAGRTTLTTDIGDSIHSARSGGRLSIRGGVSRLTPRGVFRLDGGIDKSSAITGLPATTGFATAQASSLRLLAGPHAPTFNVIAWMNLYPGAPSNGPAVRAGMDLPLPSQFALAVDVERNPYRATSGSGVPLVAAIRFERSFGLPSMRRPTAQGRVFEDRNGNGMRDGDETGIAGVMVRRGALSAVTAPDGSYRFYDRAAPNTVPIVDIGSLTSGQLAPNRAPEPGNTHWDLPVQRTGRIRVQLVPMLDTMGRLPTTRLSSLSAIATDSGGAAWVAHADSNGVAVFDALPAGRYKVSLDLSGTTERLRALQAPTEILLTTSEDLPIVYLKFGYRPARVFDGGAAGTGGLRRR